MAFAHNDHGKKILFCPSDRFGVCYEGVIGACSTLQVDKRISQVFSYKSNES